MAIEQPQRQHLTDLFEHYQRTRDPADREELVAAHLRLAVHLARRFANRGLPVEDLEQVAAIGLVHAVDRFDPSRGLEFSTFATPTIVGELKRHFRDRGWSVRVPRRIQELHLRLSVVLGEATHELGRSPTIAEVAERAQCSEEDVLEAMEAGQAYRSSSIDAEWSAPDPTARSRPQLACEDTRLFAAENRVFIDGLLGLLPAREQLMIRMRFYEEMTQVEIAERLGISQMHVSRLLSRCLDALRVHIESNRPRLDPDHP
ncbi:MAG: SigB/SigF/SigG family RNA polymerase sigma factor [Acidimicrobiales bacterium]